MVIPIPNHLGCFWNLVNNGDFNYQLTTSTGWVDRSIPDPPGCLQVILLKQWDSDGWLHGGSRANFTLHSAFKDPSSPEDGEDRVSCEAAGRFCMGRWWSCRTLKGNHSVWTLDPALNPPLEGALHLYLGWEVSSSWDKASVWALSMSACLVLFAGKSQPLREFPAKTRQRLCQSERKSPDFVRWFHPPSLKLETWNNDARCNGSFGAAGTDPWGEDFDGQELSCMNCGKTWMFPKIMVLPNHPF